MKELDQEEILNNAAYGLFRLMGNWIARQCYEIDPSYSREQLLKDIKSSLKDLLRNDKDK